MIFSSMTFLVFFCIVYALILIFNNKKLRATLSETTQLRCKHSILLVASYVFYGWWDYRFCFLMLALTFTAWLCAKHIAQDHHRRLYTAIGVVFPLVILGFFKYFNFFVDSFTSAFGIESVGTLNIILPVGISFYTFQSMSYTLDVLRGKVPSCSFADTALYIAFFPQLVAGPILKSADFMPQLKRNDPLRLADFGQGLQVFLFGLFKKIVIADNLSVFVDDVFAKPLAFSSLSVVLAVVSYSIQIYCDFSGYSDMAIGVAKCFGYDFMRNFNMPYISRNVSEFWKRWHISLSSWLQEYLYIPLGGNRKGVTRTYINLLLTMVLGGLWHGANYTFILWGLLHGLALCVHKFYAARRKKTAPTAVGTTLSVLVTYVFVCICWVFFRAADLQTALDVLYRMFVWQSGITQIFSWTVVGIVACVACHLCAILRSKRQGLARIDGYYPLVDLTRIGGLTVLFTVMLAIALFAYTNANPFIYFQF